MDLVIIIAAGGMKLERIKSNQILNEIGIWHEKELPGEKKWNAMTQRRETEKES